MEKEGESFVIAHKPTQLGVSFLNRINIIGMDMHAQSNSNRQS